MLRAFILLSLFCGSIATAAPSKPWERDPIARKYVPVNTWGYSNDSCASVLNNVSDVQRRATELYILGVWSGLNMGEDVNAGHTTDGPGITGEVELYCQTHPSENLLETIVKIRDEFKSSNR